MSLHVDFEPYSWYMGFAIEDCRGEQSGLVGPSGKQLMNARWYGVTADGMTGYLVEREAETLDDLKAQIRDYHLSKFNGYGERIAARRLEYLRGELRAERISYGELAELFKLHEYIKDGDVELLEAAGVPEGSRA